MTYDILTIGRSSIDLYAQQTGIPFTEIESFAAYVGGCPTNIAVGTKRLGLKSALLTAIGADPVGEFIVNFLNKEGVATQWIPTKEGRRSSAVVLGIQPPDKFPLVFYRDNCADIALTVDDVKALGDLSQFKVVVFSGTGFSQEPSRSAHLHLLDQAKKAGVTTVFDIDFRPDQWLNVKSFGLTLRAILPSIDIVLGTQDELNALFYKDEFGEVSVKANSISDAKVTGDLNLAIKTVLDAGVKTLVLKRGAEGASVFELNAAGEQVETFVPGFKVDVMNVLGAGDAFASGFLYGYVNGWDWTKCLTYANATGAIVVTRHGCANFMPTVDEVETLIQDQSKMQTQTGAVKSGKKLASKKKETALCP